MSNLSKMIILGKRDQHKKTEISSELKEKILKDASEMRKEIDKMLKKEKEVEQYCTSGEVKVWFPWFRKR